MCIIINDLHDNAEKAGGPAGQEEPAQVERCAGR